MRVLLVPEHLFGVGAMSIPVPLPPKAPKPSKPSWRAAKTCRHCGAVLKRYEEREGFCDDCLRAHQTR